MNGKALAMVGGVVAVPVVVGLLIGGPRLGGLPVLVWTGLLAMAVQWSVFLPSFRAQTERWYDLTGAATHLSVVGSCLLTAVGSGRAGPTSWLVAGMVGAWAMRLGWFLFRRVHREGGDRRFDDIKASASRFLVAWTLQGLWVWLTTLAAQVLLLDGPPVDAFVVFGAVIWAIGWGVEIVADRQKTRFRADPEHRGRFITSGLWSWSRHPNYAGEIVLWVGVFVMGLGHWHGGGWLTALSPLFVYLLLRHGSGVPLLEASADARWGDDPAYQAYRDRTPVLWPWGRGG